MFLHSFVRKPVLFYNHLSFVPGNVEQIAEFNFYRDAVAAAEVVVALAIFVSLFKQRKTADVTHMDAMKG